MAFAFFLGGPSGCVCFASCSSARAPAEGAAMAGWQPLSVRERGRCGAAAGGHRVAALSQCSPSCAVQGRTLKKSCVFIVSSYGYRPLCCPSDRVAIIIQWGTFGNPGFYPFLHCASSSSRTVC